MAVFNRAYLLERSNRWDESLSGERNTEGS
jgi:hypothetical protein